MTDREFSAWEPAFTAARRLREKLEAREHGPGASPAELRTDAPQVGALFLRAAQAIDGKETRNG